MSPKSRRTPAKRATKPASKRSAKPKALAAARAKKKRAAAAELEPAPVKLEIRRGDEVLRVPDRLPLLPLRDVVVFPWMSISLLVGRLPSVNAIEKAMSRDRLLFVTAQKRSEVADPQHDELFRTGTIARVLQLFRLPDGTLRVLVEGLVRAEAKRFQWSSDYYSVQVAPAPDPDLPGAEHEALTRHALQLFQDYVHLNRRIPDEVLATTASLTDPVQLSHTIAANLLVKVPVKQNLLEAPDAAARLRQLAEARPGSWRSCASSARSGQVRSQVHKNQKEFYLNEQRKAIRKELGHQNEFASELEDLQEAIRKAKMPREVRARRSELERLAHELHVTGRPCAVTSTGSALPWRTVTRDN